jgi:hypothetical protein
MKTMLNPVIKRAELKGKKKRDFLISSKKMEK